jgi:hypothetical protein
MSTELGRQILEAVRAYVASHVDRVRSSVEQVAASLDELRSAVETLPKPQKGDKGDRGDDGRPPTTDELRGLIAPLIPPAIPGPAGECGQKGETPSTEELLAIIRPLIPPAAPPGERGERGERGPPGRDGQTPSAEELRSIITPLIPAPIPGERGIDGSNGSNGRDGRDGADGRDAAQIDVLPGIDATRSYPRGTYARHAGGLWRAFESTHAMRGWECIVEGITDESETLLDDGRTLVRRTLYSSGRTFERSITMAVVLDKGVYKQDSQYAPGDAVTWAGSIWIAQRRDDAALPYGKPSTPGSGWRLAVKAGRDARP